jgi:hypothetical protein
VSGSPEFHPQNQYWQFTSSICSKASNAYHLLLPCKSEFDCHFSVCKRFFHLTEFKKVADHLLSSHARQRTRNEVGFDA